jgi:hypothetical protein
MVGRLLRGLVKNKRLAKASLVNVVLYVIREEPDARGS